MKIVIAGATGFIGPTLIHKYNRTGNHVAVLSRSMFSTKTQFVSYVSWDAVNEGDWEKTLDGADAVVNLAGEPIAAKKWTPEQKKLIEESRVNATRAIVRAIGKTSKKPSVLINASAVGYYGDQGNGALDESSPKGVGYLSDVCQKWEQEALKAEELGVRTVVVRIGVVLEKEGGALSKFIPPFQMFMGGPLGNGKQWMSWIHRDDLIQLLSYLIENKEIQGIVNGTAPNPVTMKEFATTLGGVMNRPSLMKVPGFVLKLKLGEMAKELLLSGQRALPKKIEAAGFKFSYPTLESALNAIFGKEKLKKYKKV